MNPRIITTLAISVLSLLAVFFLVFPQFGKVRDMRANLAEKRLTTNKILEKLNTTKLAISEFQDIDKSRKELAERALPDDIDLPNLLFLLDSTISSSGLIAENITVNPANPAAARLAEAPAKRAGQAGEEIIAPSAATGLGQVRLGGEGTVNLTVRGGYESFKAFLKALEQNLRIFDVEMITFSSPKATKEGFESTRFSIVLRTYFNE